MSGDDIPPLTKRIRAIRDPGALERWYAELTRASAVALARMVRVYRRRPAPAPGPDAEGGWISLQKAAALLDVHAKWLWRHRHDLPFMEPIDEHRWRVNKSKLHEHMGRKRR